MALANVSEMLLSYAVFIAGIVHAAPVPDSGADKAVRRGRMLKLSSTTNRT
ncbi:hypothetical protein [Caballeronia arvi]|uniref:hypothetical protein n=1 Tax=Caballeronia arvi TaxID=1777135 RepID=UPI000A7865FB|nr:hypothetical protein [Caballeronia arvi]